MQLKSNNIKTIYVISFLQNAFFWYAIWVFFYLLYTDYAGIGLIEAVMVFAFIVFEIPSGALSDLVGKKKTIMLASVFAVAGSIIMATAPSFSYLLIAALFYSVSGAFFSGTIEALAYDSLKENKEEGNYDKVISNMTSLGLVSIAIASVIGGYLFTIDPSLPLWGTAFTSLLAMFVVLFLKEPDIDTEKFSWKTFLIQNKQGLGQLAKTPEIRRQTILLLSIGLFAVFANEMLDSLLAVEFGFSPKQLSIFLAILSLLAALASQATSKLSKHFELNNLFLFIGVSIVATLVVSPYLGLMLGGVSLALRIMLQSIFGNLSSLVINKNTDSKYRVTTLSTFNLMKNIPYVIVVYFVGYIMDIISAKVFASGMGMAMLLLLVSQYIMSKSRKKQSK